MLKLDHLMGWPLLDRGGLVISKDQVGFFSDSLILSSNRFDWNHVQTSLKTWTLSVSRRRQKKRYMCMNVCELHWNQ